MTYSLTHIKIKGKAISEWVQQNRIELGGRVFNTIAEYLDSIAAKIDDNSEFCEGTLLLDNYYTITDLLKALLIYDGIDLEEANCFVTFLNENAELINRETTIKIYSAYLQSYDDVYLIERRTYRRGTVDIYSLDLSEVEELDLGEAAERKLAIDPLSVFIPKHIDKALKDNEDSVFNQVYNELFPYKG